MSKDKDFIHDMDRWPQFPVLPMRRKGASGEGSYGFIHAIDVPSQQFKVYIGNIFDIDDKGLSKFKFEYVESIDRLLNEWRVD